MPHPSLTTALLVVCVIAFGIVSWRLQRARGEIARLRDELLDRRDPSPVKKASRAVRVVAGAAARVRDKGVSGFLLSSAEDLTRWAMEDRSGIARIAGPDGTVTIFFSDIEDSTALNERIGDRAWVSLLAKHDTVIRANVDRHRGHIVKSQGDGFMIVFREPGDAVRAAIGIQQVLDAGRGRRLRRNPIRIRIGIHTGHVIAKDGDYFGRNVAMAARVAAEADGGEILVSDDVCEGLDAEVPITELEDVRLKGLEGEHTLWRVDWR